jgi:lipoyl(octanoyl) transferase
VTLSQATRSASRLLTPGGPVPYAEAYAWMHQQAEARLRGDVPDTIMLLEHPPVYTAGRRWQPDHLRWTQDAIERAGAELHVVDRGGSVTFHGPGQLVGYPVVDLGIRPDVPSYVWKLEEAVIRASAEAGIHGLGRNPVNAGVWAGDRKVCAIGVRVLAARVTLHGFALNCSTDLAWFDAIVPCGLTDTGVTTLSALAGRPVTVAEMRPLVARHLADQLGLKLTAGD